MDTSHPQLAWKPPSAGGKADPESRPDVLACSRGEGPGVPQRAPCETTVYFKGTVLMEQISGTEGSTMGRFFLEGG